LCETVINMTMSSECITNLGKSVQKYDPRKPCCPRTLAGGRGGRKFTFYLYNELKKVD